MTDYAVVVGIACYPGLSVERIVADLEGPDNDAQGVYDWLVDSSGGMLDPSNVKLIRSADCQPLDPDDPRPDESMVERELKWLERQTRETPGGRLYLYFSGHGFAPILEEGAIFTAEASQVSPSYVYADAWLRWFRKAQRFRQFVLWMDCCMDFQQSIPVREVLMRAQLGTGVPGPAFVAVAAQTKRALERRMADGRVHGVFTWTLLKGLHGGASDERGYVTAESLRTFLYAVMPEFLPDDARTDATIDLQPFVRADDGISFHRLPARPKYPVHLTIPEASAGEELKIWSHRPPAQVVSDALDGKEWTGELVRGLYVAEVQSARLRHGFQVSGAGAVEVKVTRQGQPVTPCDGSELFDLHVVADNPAAAITVLDHRFDRIFSATGELHERELPGVYKVRTEFGRDITTISDEVLLLDRDLHPGRGIAPLQLLSPAPIPGSALTNDSHLESFNDAADRRGEFAGPKSGKAAISVLARYWIAPSAARSAESTFPHPMHGLRIVSGAGKSLADLSRDCQADERVPADPVALWERELPPGAYFLRLSLPGRRVYEGCIVASRDWVTQIAIRRERVDLTSAPTAPLGPMGDAAVFMRPSDGTARDPNQDATIEAARIALTQGRNLFAEGHGAQLKELLLSKYNDPIAGIIGCHLLLQAAARHKSESIDAELFDTAVTKLRELVGEDNPDVEALSLKSAKKGLRATRPFTVPPMFSPSWTLVAQASYDRPQLVPFELWERVHASAEFGPLFVWAVDQKTKSAHARQLSDWMGKYAVNIRRRRSAALPPPLPKAAREAGRRMRLPAVATTALWHDREASQ